MNQSRWKGNKEQSMSYCPKHEYSNPPDSWEEKLMDEFCVMFERATRQDDKTDWVEKLESFISQLLDKAREEGLQLRKNYTDFNEDEAKRMVERAKQDTLTEVRKIIITMNLNIKNHITQ